MPGRSTPPSAAAGTVIVATGLQPVATVIAANQDILVGGNFPVAGSVGVARLLPSGHLDASFGSGGLVTLPMGEVMAMTAASDGSVLLAGIAPSERDAELVRLLPSGKLDRSFGSGGAVQFDYVANSSNGALTVLLAPHAKIVAGGFGSAVGSDVFYTSVARFNHDGSADVTFGMNGIVAQPLVGGVTALGLQQDGKLLACGGFFAPNGPLVVRFLPNGTLDGSVGGDSLLRTSAHTGSLTFGGANIFQSDGRLVQWSNTVDRSGHREAVRVERRTRKGARDRGFAITPFTYRAALANVAKDVAIAGDGSLLVAGEGTARQDLGVFGLARLTPNGTLDPSFGAGGRVTTAFGGQAEATAVALQADGKIVLAGQMAAGGPATTLVLARYLNE